MNNEFSKIIEAFSAQLLQFKNESNCISNTSTIQSLFPHAFSPYPSMAVVECIPPTHQTQPLILSNKTRFQSNHHGKNYFFSPLQETLIFPISKQDGAITDKTLSLNFKSHTPLYALKKYAQNPLKLYFDVQDNDIHELLLLLDKKLAKTFILIGDKTPIPIQLNNPSSDFLNNPLGQKHSHPIESLKCFSYFPALLNFREILLPECLFESDKNEFSIVFHFNTLLTFQTKSIHSIKIHCASLINRFEKILDPIFIDASYPEVRIKPAEKSSEAKNDLIEIKQLFWMNENQKIEIFHFYHRGIHQNSPCYYLTEKLHNEENLLLKILKADPHIQLRSFFLYAEGSYTQSTDIMKALTQAEPFPSPSCADLALKTNWITPLSSPFLNTTPAYDYHPMIFPSANIKTHLQDELVTALPPHAAFTRFLSQIHDIQVTPIHAPLRAHQAAVYYLPHIKLILNPPTLNDLDLHKHMNLLYQYLSTRINPLAILVLECFNTEQESLWSSKDNLHEHTERIF